MALSLNHISIRATDLAACQRFYCDVLGMKVGPRPPFPFPGLWIYAGDTSSYANAVVHILHIDPNDAGGLKAYLGDRDESSLQGTGVVDHVAFFATGLGDTLARLSAHGLTCTERTVPLLGLYQVFVIDPSGVVVELNFPAEEKAALAA